jgi:hypothetical protein
VHYFSGHAKDGFFWIKDDKGIYRQWTAGEVRADRQIVWMVTKDSGYFYWPHVLIPGSKQPVELNYDVVV